MIPTSQSWLPILNKLIKESTLAMKTNKRIQCDLIGKRDREIQ